MCADRIPLSSMLIALLGAGATTAGAQDHDAHDQHAPASTHELGDGPALPAGMTLDEVLDRAAQPPPAHWPAPLHDNPVFAYLLVEQFEYRVPFDSSEPHLGWEAGAWVGTDRHRLKLDLEGEWEPEGNRAGEAKIELRYARPITPFWSLEGGVRSVIEWQDDQHTEDLWAGVIVLSGLTPYQIEMDTTLVLTEDSDWSLEWEMEYDLRLTQRLVLQPHLETALHAQDVPERGIAAGVNDLTADLRLRYEFRRWLAPYVGLRFRQVVGAARDLTVDDEEFFLLTGLRWAW